MAPSDETRKNKVHMAPGSKVPDPRGQNLAPGQLSIFPRISFMTLPAGTTDFIHLKNLNPQDNCEKKSKIHSDLLRSKIGTI